jgi:hypothetical protein
VRAFLSCEATNAATLAPFSESCTAQIQAWRLSTDVRRAADDAGGGAMILVNRRIEEDR